MADFEKFFVGFVSFFGILSVIGIYLGYMHLIVFPLNVVAIVVAFFGAIMVARRIGRTKGVVYWKHLAVVLLFLGGLDVYISMPYMVYPHSYVDFGLNTAQARLVTNDGGFPSFAHVYPNVYYGVFAIFNSLIWHAYSVSSVIAIVMQVMTVLAVFLVAREVFDEKTGLIAAFLYGFSLVNILLLEQGYLTQNFGTFFFAAALYAAVMVGKSENRKYGAVLVLSFAGLVSYPHFFTVAFFAVALFYRCIFKYLIWSILLVSLEISGMIIYYMSNIDSTLNSLVMYGGIFVPNLLVLFVLIFAFVGYIHAYRASYRSKNGTALFGFMDALVIVMSVFVAMFIFNYFFVSLTVVGRDIRQLYTVVKLLYLLFVPASVFAGYAVRKYAVGHWVNVLFLFLVYGMFFSGYALMIPDKSNLPDELYFASEELAEANNEYGTASYFFDPCITDNNWIQPWIYDTLYGRPDNYSLFSNAELKFVAQGNWVSEEFDSTYRSAIGLNVTGLPDIADNVVGYCGYHDYGDYKDLYYRTGNLVVYRNA